MIAETEMLLKSRAISGDVVDVRVDRAGSYVDAVNAVEQLQRGCDCAEAAMKQARGLVVRVQKLVLSPENVVGDCPLQFPVECAGQVVELSFDDIATRWFTSGVTKSPSVNENEVHCADVEVVSVVDSKGSEPSLELEWQDVDHAARISGGVQVSTSPVLKTMKFGEWDGASDDENAVVDTVVGRVNATHVPTTSVVKFWRDVVRSPNTRAVAKAMCDVVGVEKLPGKAWLDLALATYTSATVPAAFKNGRAQLKSLALVGDAALTDWLAREAFRLGAEASSTQEIRSKSLGTQSQCVMLDALGWLRYVSVASGVSPLQSKVGADVFESFAGVISIHFGRDGVQKFCDVVGLIAE